MDSGAIDRFSLLSTRQKNRLKRRILSMSCSLTPVTPRVQYKAKVGSQVTVEVKAAKNTGARIVKLGYDVHSDGEPKDDSPH